jgi:hypothetical protein
MSNKEKVSDSSALGPYLLDGWNMMDWCNYMCFTVSAACQIASLATLSPDDNDSGSTHSPVHRETLYALVSCVC